MTPRNHFLRWQLKTHRSQLTTLNYSRHEKDYLFTIWGDILASMDLDNIVQKLSIWPCLSHLKSKVESRDYFEMPASIPVTISNPSLKERKKTVNYALLSPTTRFMK
jgi:hypothetical protein